MYTPTKDQISLAQHVLEVIARLPADFRGITWGDNGITFELAHEVYCRQCHVETLHGSVFLSYTELLTRTEPQWEGDTDTDWDAWAANRVIKERWEKDLEERRKAKR